MKNLLKTTLISISLVIGSLSLVACKKAGQDTNTASDVKASSEPSVASQTKTSH